MLLLILFINKYALNNEKQMYNLYLVLNKYIYIYIILRNKNQI